MNCVSSLVLVLHCVLQVNACQQGLNFTIDPVRAYVGQTVSFVCFLKGSSSSNEVSVNASDGSDATCGLLPQANRKSGFFEKLETINCSENGSTSLTIRCNATADMGNVSYTCQASIYSGALVINRCKSDGITLYVTEIPKLYLIPEDMTFDDTQTVAINCSTNSDIPVNVSLALRHSTGTTVNTSLSSVALRINASRELHNAEVHCEAPEESRVTTKTTTIRINYIFALESVVPYHTANGSHTFDCTQFIESYPGAEYEWLVNSTLATETKSSYTCEEPQWCNTSVTCVAKNNVTHVRANVTFIYQRNQPEIVKFRNQSSAEENGNQINVETIIVIAVCTGVTIVITSIVAVLVWKRCICRRYVDLCGRLLCCNKKDEVIDMNDNDLYEAMPMVAAAATSIQPEESLVVASATVAGNLKHKVRSNVYLVLFSDQSCTLTAIQEKVDETVQRRNSLKHVAFLLRCANKRLVLSSSDNVNIDVNSVVSDRRLGDFLKQLVERYMDKSSDELRLDLLNYPDLGASRRAKVVKKLTSLLGIPVFLSHDMYGVTTAIDDRRCAADVYFNRRHIENQVIYTEVDLSKDSRRFPADSHEKVVYSEVLRPPLRPPRSTSH